MLMYTICNLIYCLFPKKCLRILKSLLNFVLYIMLHYRWLRSNLDQWHQEHNDRLLFDDCRREGQIWNAIGDICRNSGTHTNHWASNEAGFWILHVQDYNNTPHWDNPYPSCHTSVLICIFYYPLRIVAERRSGVVCGVDKIFVWIFISG